MTVKRSTPPLRWPALALGPALYATGCLVSFPVDEPAVIACSRDADCPGGRRCNDRGSGAGFCVERGADTSAPSIAAGSALLSLPLPEGCGLTELQQARAGGTVGLLFTTARPVREPPTVVATRGETRITFSVTSVEERTFRFVAAVPAEAEPGLYAITAELVESLDRASVEVEPDLPLVVAAAPDVLSEEAVASILYRRAPWGAVGTAGAPGSSLRASPGTLPPGLSFWISAPEPVAVGVVASDGGFEAPIPTSLAQPRISFADPACNLVPVGDPPRTTVGIQRVEWLATLAAAGGGGPDTLWATTRFGPGRSQGEPLPAGEVALATALDGLGPATQGAGIWAPIQTRGTGPRSYDPSLSLDSNRGQILLFGGRGMLTPSGPWAFLDQTWRWTGWRWVQLDPARKPTPRASAAMVYDAQRDLHLVFGGSTAAASCATPAPDRWLGGADCFLGDTWTGGAEGWTQVQSEQAPSPRYRTVATYDSHRGRVVLFGGGVGDGADGRCPAEAARPLLISDDCILGDTWEWDGQGWLRREPAVAPRPRTAHVMAYDEVRQRVVLFGGLGYVSVGEGPCSEVGTPVGAYCLYDDTWEWDGQSWTLADAPSLPTASGRPQARFSASATTDRVTGRAALFGGKEFDAMFDDLWEWNGEDWQEVTSLDRPQARAYGAMAYDPNRAALLVHGGITADPGGGCEDGFPGEGGFCLMEDTWIMADGRWSQGTQRVGPPPRFSDRLVWDAARSRLLLWSGAQPVSFDAPCPGSPELRNIRGLCPTDELWEWDGSAWQERGGPSDPWPPPRAAAAFAHDPVRGVSLLFGGLTGDLSAGVCPPGASAVAGGSCLYGDTWEWDGNAWEEKLPGLHPPPLWGVAMAFDPVSERMILFGGNRANGDPEGGTWAWDGVEWTELVVGNAPSARSHPLATLEPTSGRLLLFGGNAATGYQGDTWRWTGADWEQVADSGPPPREDGVLVGDPDHGMTLLYGGIAGNLADDTWLWDGELWRQAALAPGSAMQIGSGGVWDPLRAQIVIFGGYDAGVLTDAVSAWDPGVTSKPGQIFELALDRDTALRDRVIEEVAVGWYAAGSGHDGEVPASGAALLIWDEGRWKQKAAHAVAGFAGLHWSTAEDSEWTSLDPTTRGERLGRLFTGADQLLTLAVVSAGTNGDPSLAAEGYAEVASDFAEVRVLYRLLGD